MLSTACSVFKSLCRLIPVHQHCAPTLCTAHYCARSGTADKKSPVRKRRRNPTFVWLTAGFRRSVDEILPLPRYYTAYIYSWLSTFRDKLSVTFSNVKQSKYRTACTETSITNYQSTLPNIPKQRTSRIRRMAFLYNRCSY